MKQNGNVVVKLMKWIEKKKLSKSWIFVLWLHYSQSIEINKSSKKEYLSVVYFYDKAHLKCFVVTKDMTTLEPTISIGCQSKLDRKKHQIFQQFPVGNYSQMH